MVGRKCIIVVGTLCSSLCANGLHFFTRFLPSPLLLQVDLDLLIDGRIHKHGKDHRSGSIDRHRDGGGWIGESEPGVKLFHIIQRADAHTGIANFPVNIGAKVRIFSVEGYRVEGGGKPSCGHPFAEIMETTVGLFWRALPCEHSGGIFALAF